MAYGTPSVIQMTGNEPNIGKRKKRGLTSFLQTLGTPTQYGGGVPGLLQQPIQQLSNSGGVLGALGKVAGFLI